MQNQSVTQFLDEQNHPLRKEIELLRHAILSANEGVSENIKWNGPNYYFQNEDRITMRIHPPKQIQLVFHRGAKVKEQPKDKLIKEDFGLLVWKENDRAVATFKSLHEIESRVSELIQVITDWLQAAK